MIQVLFVCLGNICRSPMAEAVFRHMIKNEQLEHQIAVDSAATGTWHIGKPPHRGTLEKLTEYNIPVEGLVCRRLEKADFEKFDYIVGMDDSNLHNIYQIVEQPNHSKIVRLLDLTNTPQNVPDPYYTGNFQETYELVTEGCKALLDKIKAENVTEK